MAQNNRFKNMKMYNLRIELTVLGIYEWCVCTTL